MRMMPALSSSATRPGARSLRSWESLKPDDPSQYTIDTVYAYLEAWIEDLKLDRPAVMVGHSMVGI